MKIQHKIIILPIIVMIIIFSLGMLMVEYQVKSTLENKFKQELQTLTLVALSAIETKNYKFDNHSINNHVIDNSFDRIADNVAKMTYVRVSYFSYEGDLLGDSSLDFTTIVNHKNQRQLPEIISALANNTGFAQRTDSHNVNIFYYTKFDVNSGIIARVSAPKNFYNKTLIDIRRGFSVIILATLLAIFIFASIAIRLISKAVLQERIRLQKEITEKTKEITLIQTMTTMVNDADNIEDAGAILANILPKLLPVLSGAIYLTKPPERLLSKICYWGNWPKGISVATNDKSSLERFNLVYAPVTDSSDNRLSIEQFSRHSFGVNLVADQHIFGKIFFVDNQNIIDENMRKVIQHLVEPINCALANVQLKILLKEQATKDPLTGLYNRRYMLEALTHALHQADRYDRHVAVLMIDLDHFKTFNDKFGHEAGDLVLARVAEQFMTNLRLEDIACRYGGEEFCIICPDTNLKEAYQLAEKLRLKIAALSIMCQEQRLDDISMSIGIAIYPNHADNGHDLMIQADKALYLAKNNGRNCTVVNQVSNHKSLLSR
ncbi:MAG: GGDEF domain-containing protein [Alteromonadaceae bacterium]|nr:GGDEF domain-containing protein [Alteromonadaceae bacterium]